MLLSKDMSADGKISALISQTQAVKLRSMTGSLGYSDIFEVIVKNPKRSRSVTLSEKKLSEYFPEDYTREQITEEVFAMLEERKKMR